MLSFERLAKSKSLLWAAWTQKTLRWFNQFICI